MYADLVDDDALHREILQIDLGIGDRSYGVASNPHLPGYMLVTGDVELRPDGQNVEYQGQMFLINVMSPVLGEFTSILDLPSGLKLLLITVFKSLNHHYLH